MFKYLSHALSPLSGHFWTLAQPWHYKRSATEQCLWNTTVSDTTMGSIRLSGALSGHLLDENLVILIHGMGGHANSAYLRHASQHVEQQGLACLRLSLRGADRSGEDMYHSGLTADLHATLLDPQLKRFRNVWIIGFSLGGHMALRFATEPHDTRVRGVVSISSPLELDQVAHHLDSAPLWIYRKYLLYAVTQIYAAIAKRRSVPVPLDEVRRAHTVRHWDSLVLVPRFGFNTVDDYYHTMSVGPLLSKLLVPSLLIHSTLDPIVPIKTITPWLASACTLLDARIVSIGGHVNFPTRMDLGHGASKGLMSQVLHWCVNEKGVGDVGFEPTTSTV